MIILATVSVGVVFKGKFIEIATNATVNYAQLQVNEEKDMNYVYDVMENTVQKIESKNPFRGNSEIKEDKVTEIENIEEIKKTTNSITITLKVKAIDENVNKITYRVYTKKVSEGENTEWIEKGSTVEESEKETITIVAKELEQYTEYYLKLEADNGTAINKLESNSTIRTMCPSGLLSCKGAKKEVCRRL